MTLPPEDARPDDVAAAIRSVVLERLRFHARIGVLPEENLEVFVDHVGDHLAHAIARFFALGRVEEDVVEECVVEVPVGWRSLLPAWLRRWLPPRVRRIAMLTRRVTYRVCPHVGAPDDRTHMEFLAAFREKEGRP